MFLRWLAGIWRACMTPIERIARELCGWHGVGFDAAWSEDGWRTYIDAATDLYAALHERDECICDKCGIRHGGRKGDGSW